MDFLISNLEKFVCVGGLLFIAGISLGFTLVGCMNRRWSKLLMLEDK